MNKLIISLLSVIILSGCNPSTNEHTSDYILPEAFKDCKIYSLYDG